jgi:hypothetical protein
MKDLKQIIRTVWLLIISIPIILAFSHQVHLLLSDSIKADLLMFSWLFIAIIVICLQWGYHVHEIMYKNND